MAAQPQFVSNAQTGNPEPGEYQTYAVWSPDFPTRAEAEKLTRELRKRGLRVGPVFGKRGGREHYGYGMDGGLIPGRYHAQLYAPMDSGIDTHDVYIAMEALGMLKEFEDRNHFKLTDDPDYDAAKARYAAGYRKLYEGVSENPRSCVNPTVHTLDGGDIMVEGETSSAQIQPLGDQGANVFLRSGGDLYEIKSYRSLKKAMNAATAWVGRMDAFAQELKTQEPEREAARARWDAEHEGLREEFGQNPWPFSKSNPQLVDRRKVSPYALASDYKYRGIGRSRAWSQFVIDRNLSPGMDAKDFYAIFDRAIAAPLEAPGELPAEKREEEAYVPSVSPEFADYGKQVEVTTKLGRHVETKTGTVHRTMQTTSGAVYEVDFGSGPVRLTDRDEVRFLNPWPFSKSTPACATKPSSMNLASALKLARKAGDEMGDTGLFDQWLCSVGLHTRGGYLKRKLEAEFGKGVEQGGVKEPSNGGQEVPVYKGVGIHRTDGGYYTDLDPETRFEDVKLAKAFIGEWKKKENPSDLKPYRYPRDPGGSFDGGVDAGREAAEVFYATSLDDVRERLRRAMHKHRNSPDRYSQGFIQGWRQVGLTYARAKAGNPSPSGSGIVHLQGIGDFEGTPVEQLKPGMKVGYNFGYTSTVLAVEPKTGLSVTLRTRDREGKEWASVKRKGTLMAAFWPKEGNPSGSGKEPWRMTLDEYLSVIEPDTRSFQKGWRERAEDRIDEQGEPIHGAAMFGQELKSARTVFEYTGKGDPPASDVAELRRFGFKKTGRREWFGLVSLDHHFAVRKALDAGKPVPPEVLADYPDLKKENPASGSGKEPWRMTREEYLNREASRLESSIESEVGDAHRKSGQLSKRFGDRERARLQGIADSVRRGESGVNNQMHRALVQRAVDSGRTVPAHVLADYPDLKRGNPGGSGLAGVLGNPQKLTLAEALYRVQREGKTEADVLQAIKDTEGGIDRLNRLEAEGLAFQKDRETIKILQAHIKLYRRILEHMKSGAVRTKQLWRVRFMRKGSEPPYPFGITHQEVEAGSRMEAIRIVRDTGIISPTSGYPVTASRLNPNPACNGRRLTAVLIPQREVDGSSYRVAPIRGPEGMIYVEGAFPSRAQAERTVLEAVREAVRRLPGKYQVEFSSNGDGEHNPAKLRKLVAIITKGRWSVPSHSGERKYDEEVRYGVDPIVSPVGYIPVQTPEYGFKSQKQAEEATTTAIKEQTKRLKGTIEVEFRLEDLT